MGFAFSKNKNKHQQAHAKSITPSQNYCELTLANSMVYNSVGGGGVNALHLQVLDLQDGTSEQFWYTVQVVPTVTTGSATSITTMAPFVASSSLPVWLVTPAGTAVTLLSTVLAAALLAALVVLFCRCCSAPAAAPAAVRSVAPAQAIGKSGIANEEPVQANAARQPSVGKQILLAHSYRVHDSEPYHQEPVGLVKHKWNTSAYAEATLANRELTAVPETVVTI